MTWVIVILLAEVLLALVVRRREQDVPSWQLFLQVGVTSCLLAVLAWMNGSASSLLIPAAFFITAVPPALQDLRVGRLPNWLVGVSYVVTVSALLTAALWWWQPTRLVVAFVGSAVFFLFYAALYIFASGQLGGGDVKLAGVAGAVLGWQGWPSLLGGLLLIWIIGALWYLIVSAAGTKKLASGQPHGPSLVIGTFAACMYALC